MIKTIEKYPLASLSIAIISMLLLHLDIPNVTIMEARNFITAREMIEDSNWLLTTMNGEPRYQKPPLPTWITAISGLTFGVNSLFALRLPGALMVLFLGITTYLLSLKLNLSQKNSFINALILISSFYIIVIINEAPWDIYAHGFMMAGLYFIFLFFERQEGLWKNVILSAVFIGFSIMSKGPVSVFSLFLPFIISYGFIYKFKNFRSKAVPFILWIALFSFIGLWWFLYVRIVDSEAFVAIATKEAGNWSSYNVKPFYYYWSFFTQSGLWTIPAFISLIYPYLISRVADKKAYRFTFFWTLISLILLSIIPEKKPRYLVPVLIPLALNTGFYIHYLIYNFSDLKSKKETFPVYFNFGLIAIIGISLPLILYLILNDTLMNHLFNYLILSAISILIGVLILKHLTCKKIDHVFYLVVIFMISILTFGLPLSKNIGLQSNFNPLYELHDIEQSNNIKTYAIVDISPELLWDYHGKIKNIYKNGQLELPLEDVFGLLLLNDDTEAILKELETNYSVKFEETFDMNVGSKRKERLIRQFYLVYKK
jgi:4-amino-4-deoxy-L-arabinose transferase-like glycosyltransferase